MHKKGLAEEVAKKRSRKNVKAQVRLECRMRRVTSG
jgi:hypothetical protein